MNSISSFTFAKQLYFVQAGGANFELLWYHAQQPGVWTENAGRDWLESAQVCYCAF